MSKVTQGARFVVECIWFAAGVTCIFIAAKEILRQNYSEALIFVALALAALFFFFFRRYQRRNG